MRRRIEDRPHRRGLRDAPGVKHHHAVGDFRDHAEIVGDQDHRQAGLPLQTAQQVEDLRLHGDVERGARFVGDQQLRARRERDRDHDALAHAA